jgi:hypothetical protein
MLVIVATFALAADPGDRPARGRSSRRPAATRPADALRKAEWPADSAFSPTAVESLLAEHDRAAAIAPWQPTLPPSPPAPLRRRENPRNAPQGAVIPEPTQPRFETPGTASGAVPWSSLRALSFPALVAPPPPAPADVPELPRISTEARAEPAGK